uniref:Ribonuclease H-like domain, reverse transcriptase, RNA-dependent DNA polymerase n=1 Tax=Tanacetum cinerariifolium TaxID=118510 RepID=A0A6L2LE55_TANCI|nr:ribonuclease H-like domain, reverse transcriptase, RNA-dependent DNA polymerase [Tanacetum cinerariifolium]
MTFTFADTHNMVAYLNKSDASEGFNQIIDFLNGSYIAYALTVNSTIYVSCIKQFWNTVAVKQSNDVTRLQALVDKKRVVVTEATIRDALHLDDAEGVDCLSNEEIFTTLAHMGYEKPSTKLTFYNAFFSSQWKFLTHTILQSMNAKRTSWNEFSSAIASAVICLSTASRFNRIGSFSRNRIPSFKVQPNSQLQGGWEKDAQGLKHLCLRVQPPPPQQLSPPPAQPQGAHFPMSLLQEALDACAALARRVEHLEHDKVAQDLERRMINESDKDECAKLMNEKEEKETEDVRVNPDDAQVEGRQGDIYHINMDHATKVLSMQEDEPEIQEAVEVVTTAKLITEVIAAISETVSAAAVTQADVPIAPVNVAAVVTTAAPVKVVVPFTRRRRGVVIRNPEDESSAKTPTETKSNDKGKDIMVEEPKPMKKKEQVELDEAYARKLQEELNQDIDWEVAMDHVKQKAKENPYNTAGFTLDYFKGMSYDDIRPLFEAKFNANMDFLLKSKEQIEEEENRTIALINETPAQKAAKRRRLNKEAEDVEELK